MALKVDRLTLWELAHRWNNLDPDKTSNPLEMSLEVKDTIRFLASEVFNERLYSDLWLEREERNDIPKLLKTRALSSFRTEFKDCIDLGRIDRKFLEHVTIPFWELRYWCDEFKHPMPEFWLKPDWLSGEQAPSPIIRHETVIAKTEPLTSGNSAAKSEHHRKAAKASHASTDELKRKFVRDWKEKPQKSKREAARRFYEALPPDQSKLVSPTNAVRFFTDALSAYLNKAELPEWAKGL